MTLGKGKDSWKEYESTNYFSFFVVCFLVKIWYGFVYLIEFLTPLSLDNGISIFIFGYHLIKKMKNKYNTDALEIIIYLFVWKKTIRKINVVKYGDIFVALF